MDPKHLPRSTCPGRDRHPAAQARGGAPVARQGGGLGPRRRPGHRDGSAPHPTHQTVFCMLLCPSPAHQTVTAFALLPRPKCGVSASEAPAKRENGWGAAEGRWGAQQKSVGAQHRAVGAQQMAATQCVSAASPVSWAEAGLCAVPHQAPQTATLSSSGILSRPQSLWMIECHIVFGGRV